MIKFSVFNKETGKVICITKDEDQALFYLRLKDENGIRLYDYQWIEVEEND